MAQPVAPAQARAGERFLTNVLWGWLGLAANLAVGLLLSPDIIRKRGEERYGIWALLVIPRCGILGAAWVSSTPMLLVGGLYTPWLLCRSLDSSFSAICVPSAGG